MNAEEFLSIMDHKYMGFEKVEEILTNPNYKGGRENWLLMEIGRMFVDMLGNRESSIHQPYPSGNKSGKNLIGIINNSVVPASENGICCDIRLYRPPALDSDDETYVELSCINPNQKGNRITEARKRFYEKIKKIHEIKKVNNKIHGIALLASIENLNGQMGNVPENDGVFVYDSAQEKGNRLSAWAKRNWGGNPRLVFIAITI